jgi:hypothetical protein
LTLCYSDVVLKHFYNVPHRLFLKILETEGKKSEFSCLSGGSYLSSSIIYLIIKRKNITYISGINFAHLYFRLMLQKRPPPGGLLVASNIGFISSHTLLPDEEIFLYLFLPAEDEENNWMLYTTPIQWRLWDFVKPYFFVIYFGAVFSVLTSLSMAPQAGWHYWCFFFSQE